MTKLMMLTFCAIAGALSCAPTSTGAQPKALVAAGAVAIDVRTQAEYAQGHTNTTLLPIDELEGRLAEVSTLTGGDKSKPIVVVCKSGNRAGRAKSILEKAGYTNVTNGGSWQSLQH